jgi:hypothetical protein
MSDRSRNKIIDGLRMALRYARGECRHKFSSWEGRRMLGVRETTIWSRVCAKCKVRETVFCERRPNEGTSP